MNDTFLQPENQAGQILLKLVSSGNAIIAEIRHLSSFIPSEFQTSSKEHKLTYKNILIDFEYFKNIDSNETRIESSPVRSWLNLDLIVLRSFLCWMNPCVSRRGSCCFDFTQSLRAFSSTLRIFFVSLMTWISEFLLGNLLKFGEAVVDPYAHCNF